MGYVKVKIIRNRSSTFLLPPLGRVHGNANQQRAMTMTKLSLDIDMTYDCLAPMHSQKGGVAHLLYCRDDCLAFWLIILPLLIVPSLACSVTSLGLCPEP